ncbi:MAG: Pr6Pr family membrane protein [bacterium]|nr:Pr6Pr family membrane protein [bacterium]
MLRREPRTLLRWMLAVLTAVAILVQGAWSVLHGASLWNFVSFFTIESNLVAIVALVVPGAPLLRGAATLYITITGIVYVLLLSGLEASLQTTIPWVNIVVHYVTPVALLLDWVLEPAALALPLVQVVMRWLVYPIAYLAYSLVRGALVGWYPYPFLDPGHGGYLTVARISLVIAATTAAIAFALAAYARRRHAYS